MTKPNQSSNLTLDKQICFSLYSASNAMGWVLGWVVVLATIGYFSQVMDISPGVLIALIGALHGLIIGIENGLVLVLMFILSGDRRLTGIGQPAAYI